MQHLWKTVFKGIKFDLVEDLVAYQRLNSMAIKAIIALPLFYTL